MAVPNGRYCELVAEHIRSSIADAPGEAGFRTLLTGLLAWPGRVLADPAQAKWPSFVGLTCDALGGDLRAAARAAAALEFVVAAADIADDLADDDWPDGAVPRHRGLNASWAMIWLAQRCAARLTDTIGPERAHQIGLLLAEGSLRACVGQDRDLASENCPEVSEAAALAIARAKSGALVALACQMGAAVATSDAATLDLVGRFGANVGIAAQLLNDLVDVDPEAARGSDLRRRKMTLPIAFGLRCAEEGSAPPILARYRCGETLGEAEEWELAAALRDLGALHYTWIVVEAHRREALDLLPELARCAGSDQVRHLRRLVPRAPLRAVGERERIARDRIRKESCHPAPALGRRGGDDRRPDRPGRRELGRGWA